MNLIDSRNNILFLKEKGLNLENNLENINVYLNKRVYVSKQFNKIIADENGKNIVRYLPRYYKKVNLSEKGYNGFPEEDCDLDIKVKREIARLLGIKLNVPFERIGDYKFYNYGAGPKTNKACILEEEKVIVFYGDDYSVAAEENGL